MMLEVPFQAYGAENVIVFAPTTGVYDAGPYTLVKPVVVNVDNVALEVVPILTL